MRHEGATIADEHEARGMGDTDDPLYRRVTFCPNCHARLENRRCKAMCTRCGYFDSCTDLL